MSAARQDHRLLRHADHWLSLPNDRDVPVEICAGADVPLEPSAVDEAVAFADWIGSAGGAGRGADGAGEPSHDSVIGRTCVSAHLLDRLR